MTLHPRRYVQRSAFGMGFLGFRVLPGVLLLSNRRRDRFRRARDGWERAFVQGRIGARELQAGAASAFAIIAHADAAAFRRSELQRRGVLEA